ncbi:hypothetical protein BDV96DRAFT_598117 [Lophiotrema nucula]|uniref:RING-type domain-containing protein n=1 Tax=Lophiotrema nucula TaxID=690887 RepID=A0A6A5ZCH6_9PLEO|nr:hypothetical protein BDV96DRAFT_598117 [Lophiotrema nucula]
MPQLLRSVLISADLFDLDTGVEVNPDDVCLICKEPFYPFSEDGCRPVRIMSCGHIVGDSCFESWVRTAPDKCPYWNHLLHPKTPPGNQPINILRRVCNSKWFKAQDDGMIVCFAEAEMREGGFDLDGTARAALANGSITVKGALGLFIATVKCHAKLSILFAVIVAVLICPFMFVYLYMLQKGKFSFPSGVLWWSFQLALWNHLAFDLVVLCLIGTGLTRRNVH